MFQSLDKIRYEGYGFKRNPFPYVGVPDESVEIFANRKAELRIVEESLAGSVNGTSSHIVLVGNYGNGKTATLLYVKRQVEMGLKKVLTVYLSNPGESFRDLYRNFIYEIGIERLEDIAWLYLSSVADNKNLRQRIKKSFYKDP